MKPNEITTGHVGWSPDYDSPKPARPLPKHIHVALPDGASATVDPDCPPETLAALAKLAEVARRDLSPMTTAAPAGHLEIRRILTNACQLIDGFKNDPSLAPGEWSEFDETTRREVGQLLAQFSK